jgi:hypothetical protein
MPTVPRSIVIELYGYSSVFLFALASVLTSLDIVIVVRWFQQN